MDNDKKHGRRTKIESNTKDNYKNFALKAAKELGYGWEVIRDIEYAESDAEIERILHDARNGKR